MLDVSEITCFSKPITHLNSLSEHTLTSRGPKASSPSMIFSVSKSFLQACTAVFRHLLQEVLSSNILQAQCASPAEKAYAASTDVSHLHYALRSSLAFCNLLISSSSPELIEFSMNTESLSPLRYETSVMRRTMPLSAIAAHHIEQRAPELFFLLDRLFPSDNGIAPVSISYPFPSTLV